MTLALHAAPQPPAGRARTRRPRGIGRGLVALGLVLVAACTLTKDDYEPALVDSDSLRPPDAGPSAPSSPCAGNAQCCDAQPCIGSSVCRAGACELAPAVDAGESSCTGNDCSSPPPPLVASCDDGLQNGDEQGTDCGGSCTQQCAAANVCDDGVQGDTEDGVDCGGPCSPCPPPPASCSDGARNGSESGVDCGGGSCPRCEENESCAAGRDCQSGVCLRGACAAPSCTDNTRNGDETGVDCGGGCPSGCGTGTGCFVADDCASGVCNGPCFGGFGSCCQAPSCNDGVQNGGEPSLDCGNAACGACPLGRPCSADAQCASGFCQAGECRDPGSCTDGVQNGRETGRDCGGGTCPRCPDLSGCTQPSDCNNNNCDFRGICISCGDNVIDGTETGVDCGGADPFCRRCNPGERCLINSDCVDGSCLGGFC